MIKTSSVIALLLSFAVLANSMATGNRAKQTAVSYVESADSSTYAAMIAAHNYTLVDFYASWWYNFNVID